MLRPLDQEIERNLDLAKSTKRMIENERDMLQGDIRERVTLYLFHTDVWDAVVNRGDIDPVEHMPDVMEAYRRAREYNQAVEQFRRHGNVTTYSPLIAGVRENYGRKPLIDALREKAEETEIALRDARRQVGEVLERSCPVCDHVFPHASAMKSHLTQKDDRAHASYRESLGDSIDL